MKKLLIGAMVAMLCVSNVNGSFLQTASSKNKVSVELQQEMGNYYRGMIGLANALLIGWADTLSYTEKDSAFKSNKKDLQNAKKKLSAIAKYTRSVLNRDRSNSIKKNESSAAVAAGDFVNLLGALKSTDYWRHYGAQLRFSLIVISNALKALKYHATAVDMAGVKYSSNQGLISDNGNTMSNGMTDIVFNFQDTSPSSQIDNMINQFGAIINQIKTGGNAAQANAGQVQGMGSHYKGMVGLVNSILIGWADSLSYASKDPLFKNNKKDLKEAGKKLTIIAKFVQSVLKGDKEKTIVKKNATALKAMDALRGYVDSLKGTEYWAHCGAQLRFSLVAVANALMSLRYPNIEFDAAGAKCSSEQGLIYGDGSTSFNKLTGIAFSASDPEQQSVVKDLSDKFNDMVGLFSQYVPSGVGMVSAPVLISAPQQIVTTQTDDNTVVAPVLTLEVNNQLGKQPVNIFVPETAPQQETQSEKTDANTVFESVETLVNEQQGTQSNVVGNNADANTVFESVETLVNEQQGTQSNVVVPIQQETQSEKTDDNTVSESVETLVNEQQGTQSNVVGNNAAATAITVSTANTQSVNPVSSNVVSQSVLAPTNNSSSSTSSKTTSSSSSYSSYGSTSTSKKSSSYSSYGSKSSTKKSYSSYGKL